MKLCFLNITKKDQTVLKSSFSKAFPGVDFRLYEYDYTQPLMETLREILPDFVVFDVGKIADCYSACVDIFSALPRSNTILIGGRNISQMEYFRAERVFYTPYKAYIQKPLKAEMLVQLLKEIELNYPDSPENNWIQGEFSDYDLVSIFKNDILMGKLFKGTASQEEIETASRQLGVTPGENRYFRVFMAQSANEEHDPIPNNFALFSFLKRQIRCKHLVTVAGPNELLAIISTGSKELLPIDKIGWKTLEHWLKDSAVIPQAIFISFSPVISDIKELPFAYNCACTGILQSFYSGYRSLTENSTPEVTNAEYKDIKQAVDDFALYFYSRDRQGVEKYLDDLYQESKEQSIHEILSIRALYVQLLLRLEMGENRLKKKYVPETLLTENIHSIVHCTATLEALHKMLWDKVENVFDGVLDQSTSTQVNAMHVIEYIRRNYHHPDLSLQTISDSLYLSPSHISAEFKKATGVSVNKYITDYRIKQTKYLLNNPKNKLELVAKMSGYTDAHKLSRVFKRVTGIRPSEYKMRKGIERQNSSQQS